MDIKVDIQKIRDKFNDQNRYTLNLYKQQGFFDNIYNTFLYFLNSDIKFDTYMMSLFLNSNNLYINDTEKTKYFGMLRYTPTLFTTLIDMPMFIVDENLCWQLSEGYENLEYLQYDSEIEEFLNNFKIERETFTDVCFNYFGVLPINEFHAPFMCSQSHPKAIELAKIKTNEHRIICKTNNKINLEGTYESFAQTHEFFKFYTSDKW